jgi:hypothetical protein
MWPLATILEDVMEEFPPLAARAQASPSRQAFR